MRGSHILLALCLASAFVGAVATPARGGSKVSLVAGTVPPGTEDAGTNPGVADVLWRGQRIALDSGCLRCHGWMGSFGRTAPDLVDMARGLTQPEIFTALWNHVPHMARLVRSGWRFPKLSAGDLQKVLELFLAMDHIGRPGDVARGREVLADKGCLLCHDVAEEDRVESPRLVDPVLSGSLPGLVTALFNHQPEMATALRRHNRDWPVFRSREFADLGAVLRDLRSASAPAALLQPGRPASGGRVFERLGCGECHTDFASPGTRPWSGRSAAENGTALLNHLDRIRQTASHRGIERIEEGDMADLLASLTWDGTGLQRGDPDRGWKVFRERRCIQCHRPRAEGGISTPYRKLATFDNPYAVCAAMFSHGMDMTTATKMRNVPWPRLSVDDVRDLLAFLSPDVEPR